MTVRGRRADQVIVDDPYAPDLVDLPISLGESFLDAEGSTEADGHAFVGLDRPRASTTPLTEGKVRKGGVNPPVSQIVERPAPPAPMHLADAKVFVQGGQLRRIDEIEVGNRVLTDRGYQEVVYGDTVVANGSVVMTSGVIPAEVMIPTDSDRHPNMFKTLNLLKIESPSGPIYFVVEGLGVFDVQEGDEEFQRHNQYFYESHTCPTNFVGGDIVAVFTPEDDDPHGCFEHVRSVWMTDAYLRACEDEDGNAETRYLRGIFPETLG